MRPKRKRLNQNDVAKQFVNLKKDREGFLIKEIAPKGRGVFTVASFEKGEFLLQYFGKLLTAEEGDLLEEASSSGFRFFITFKGKDYCPALCLFALRQIEPGEELLYDYGVDNLPWKTSAQMQPGREVCQPQNCPDEFQCNKESIEETDKDGLTENVQKESEVFKGRLERNGNCSMSGPLLASEEIHSLSASDTLETSSGNISQGPEIIKERFDRLDISCVSQPTDDEILSLSVIKTVDNFTENVPEGAKLGKFGEKIDCTDDGSNFGHQDVIVEQQSLPDTEIVGNSDTESAAGTFSIESGNSDDIGEIIEYSQESTQDDTESIEYGPGSIEDGTESVVDGQEEDQGNSESEVDGSSDGAESYVPESDDEGSESAYSDVIPLPRRTRTSVFNVRGGTSQTSSSSEGYAENSRRENKDERSNLSTKVFQASNKLSVAVDNTCSSTSSHSTSEDDATQMGTKEKNKVYVMTTNNTAKSRSYDKPAYCYVCSLPQKKLTVHILQHSSEPMVAQWLAAEKEPEKDKLWIKTRNFGNNLHNYGVLRQGEGELIVVY
ncbi:hypothetical protein HOLleu_20849 [Holothuria leucospilota]|uniref:SET domain-containing protein n=1 Tax=Holothuria leucospilota TaxID=206669 RepID=A0A9Q1BWQ3_HOLLE|nr:hypothetical protein HOLleu_20849 [Holothuria leucospilota]